MSSIRTLEPRFNEALDLHRRGDTHAAIDIYRELICEDPSSHPIVGLLATAWAQSGAPAIGIIWFERAFRLSPLHTETLSNFFGAALELGRTHSAIQLARFAAALQPDTPAHYLNAGKAYLQLGQPDFAIRMYAWALRILPEEGDVHAFVAELEVTMGSLHKALIASLKAIIIDPTKEHYYSVEGKVRAILGELIPRQKPLERALTVARFSPQGLLNLGDHFLKLGQFDQAQNTFRSLIAIHPGEPSGLLGHAESSSRLGQHSEAIFGFRRAALINENFAAPYNGLGIQLLQSGKFEEAAQSFKKALSLESSDPLTRIRLASALSGLERFEEAQRVLTHLIALNPEHADAYLAYTLARSPLGVHGKALRILDHALRINSDSPIAFLCKGDVLYGMGRFDEAITAYDVATQLGAFTAEISMAKGKCQHQIGQHAEAFQSFSRALNIDPKSSDTRINRGNLFLELRQFSRALEDYDWAKEQGVELAGLCINRGNALFGLSRFSEALACFKETSTIDPNSIGGAIGRAAVFQRLSQYKDALIAHEEAYLLSGEKSDHLGSILYCGIKSWDQDRLDRYLEITKEAIHKGMEVGNPFPFLTIDDDPALHLKVAKKHAQNLCKASLPKTQKINRGNSHPRIVLGYFSSDLAMDHPVGINLLPLFKMHDRERFKLVAFNTSQQSSPEFLALFDEVHDIYNTSDAEAAEISRQAEVDIAIDINGYTQGARTGIFAYRPGQIQINYLGYPGTMGTSFHDFIVADEYVISRPLERYYTENVLKLPHFFMPYDLTRSQTPNMTIPDRSTYGLPSNTFIYCSFNEFHKITSKALESWMEILRDNDNSVLWIAQRGEITEAEIRGLFRRGNISSDRIIIAHRLQNFDEHLARLSLADLMLDTFPYNSHTTACDAVTAGLPLLTISGQSFASRVSGSLMSSMALGELIARGWDDYIQKAVRLGKNPEYYTMQREALVSAKRRVRNPQAYARSLEHLFETALASVR